jgi:hypothetical protein
VPSDREDDFEKGKTITLKIGGITNPRSFKPSDPIIVTTLDTDTVSVIDTGYNIPVVNTIPGQITSGSIEPTSVTNGEVNTFTFAV